MAQKQEDETDERVIQFDSLRLEDALQFMDQIKKKFPKKPEVHKAFMGLMNEFETGKLGTPDLIQRVVVLLKDQPELIIGFKKFLPPGYELGLITKRSMNLLVPKEQELVNPGTSIMREGVSTVPQRPTPASPPNHPLQLNSTRSSPASPRNNPLQLNSTRSSPASPPKNPLQSNNTRSSPASPRNNPIRLKRNRKSIRKTPIKNYRI